MFRLMSSSRFGAGLFIAATLVGCATKPPQMSGTVHYQVVSAIVTASAGDEAFADKLDLAVEATGNTSARGATLDARVLVYRDNSPFLGVFFGGLQHAQVSGVMRDGLTGKQIDSFTVAFGVEATGANGRAELAEKFAKVIAIRAANAQPIRAAAQAAGPAKPKLDNKVEPKRAKATQTLASALKAEPTIVSPPEPIAEPLVVAAPEPIVIEAPTPVPSTLTPANQGDDPCIIGVDGKCLDL